jgi:transposase-like protein
MVALVRQWEQSAETREAFARRHGLTLATFEYWKRRVRREASTAPGATFAPVQLVSDTRSSPGSSSVDVVLNGGERLTIHEGVSVDLLRAVLVTLRTC